MITRRKQKRYLVMINKSNFTSSFQPSFQKGIWKGEVNRFHPYFLKRLQLTLLELLVVISIIASLAGVFSMNIRSALHEQRFKTEVSQLLDTLRLAQDLMLILDADLHVKIRQCETIDAIEYWIESDQPLSKNWRREIERPPKILKTIKTVRHPDAANGLIDLKFLSSGIVMSQGPLALSTSSNPNDSSAHYRFINLAGYPKPIVASLVSDDWKPQDREEMDASEKLTRWTMQEIQLIESPQELLKTSSDEAEANPASEP